MSHTITLSGEYGYTGYKVSGLDAGTTIDASAASWIVDNDNGDGNASPYPFRVYGAPSAILDGGTILGNIDLTSEWRTVYNMGNSAAVRTEDSPNVVIRDWRIDDAWDAVRVSWNCPNFLIEDVWVTNARDDAVENDRLLSGTIRDSLFDGVFGGLSIDPSSSSPVDGHNETVTLDGVLMRMQPFLYEGEITHSSLIKTDSATDGTVTPNLRFINCVFAIEDVQHHSYRSMFDAWANTIDSRGNVFLNLSDTPLPADYPKPGAGWTILEGQAARDYWQEARAEWINNHQSADAGAGNITAPGTTGLSGADVTANAGATDTTGSIGDAGTDRANTGSNGTTSTPGADLVANSGATDTISTTGTNLTANAGTADTTGTTGSTGTDQAANAGSTSTASTTDTIATTGTAGTDLTANTGSTDTTDTTDTTGSIGTTGTDRANTGSNGAAGTPATTGSIGTPITTAGTGATANTGATDATGTPGTTSTSSATGTDVAANSGSSNAIDATGSIGTTGASGSIDVTGATAATGSTDTTGSTGTTSAAGTEQTVNTGSTDTAGTAGTSTTGTTSPDLTANTGSTNATGSIGTTGTDQAANTGMTGATGTVQTLDPLASAQAPVTEQAGSGQAANDYANSFVESLRQSLDDLRDSITADIQSFSERVSGSASALQQATPGEARSSMKALRAEAQELRQALREDVQDFLAMMRESSEEFRSAAKGGGTSAGEAPRQVRNLTALAALLDEGGGRDQGLISGHGPGAVTPAPASPNLGQRSEEVISLGGGLRRTLTEQAASIAPSHGLPGQNDLVDDWSGHRQLAAGHSARLA